jgi:hypothetical protein
MILINLIYVLTCQAAYAIEGLHFCLVVIDLDPKANSATSL